MPKPKSKADIVELFQNVVLKDWLTSDLECWAASNRLGFAPADRQEHEVWNGRYITSQLVITNFVIDKKVDEKLIWKYFPYNTPISDQIPPNSKSYEAVPMPIIPKKNDEKLEDLSAYVISLDTTYSNP